MPDNIETMDTVEGAFLLPVEIAAAGIKTYRLATTNRFLDQDINVVTTTPAATFTSSNNLIYCNKAGFVAVGSTESPIVTISPATIKSTNSTASFGSITYQSSGTNSGKFTVDATGTVSAPAVDVAGYISSTIGTKNASGVISGTLVLNKIKVGTSVTGTTSLSHTLSKGSKESGEGWTDGGTGTGSATAPSSGVYIKVTAGALSTTITSSGTVVTEGYGTTSQYTADTANETTVSASAADYFVQVKSAATPSITTTNISGTGIVAVGTLADGYYPINASNVTATAKIGIGTAGWYSGSGNTTYSSTLTSSKQVGKMAAAQFTVSDNKVYCSTAGYVPQGSTSNAVGTITSRNIVISSTDPGTNYSNKTSLVLPQGGWLKLEAGYYEAQRISLATLVPDSIEDAANGFAPADYILGGYGAFDADGLQIVGTMITYDGSYTVS